jgi:hypothetical protein
MAAKNKLWVGGREAIAALAPSKGAKTSPRVLIYYTLAEPRGNEREKQKNQTLDPETAGYQGRP